MKKLDDIFNLNPDDTNDFSEKKTEKQIVDTKPKKDISKVPDRLSIQDEDYIRDELKSMVEQGKDVLKTLRNDIAIGSPPRMYEVYADLMRATFENLRELRDLNSEIIKTEYKKRDGGEKGKSAAKTTNNLILSSSELLKMVNDAKENNSLKEVKAEFDFEDREA